MVHNLILSEGGLYIVGLFMRSAGKVQWGSWAFMWMLPW